MHRKIHVVSLLCSLAKDELEIFFSFHNSVWEECHPGFVVMLHLGMFEQTDSESVESKLRPQATANLYLDGQVAMAVLSFFLPFQ
jgi:hypothetical protein